MKILLIDTCGASSSLALVDSLCSPAIITSVRLPGRSAAERLVPAIRSLVIDAGINLPELDAVAVVHGPGSFTGVRVGLSAAKGLCHGLNLPLVDISRLAVLASLCTKPTAYVHALLDAGRGEFYLGLYGNGTCLRESLVNRDQLLAQLSLEPTPIIVACEPAIAESLDATYSLALGGNATLQLVTEPTAANALPLALTRIHQRAFDDPATIDANYLRRSDAEIFARPTAAAAAAPLPQ